MPIKYTHLLHYHDLYIPYSLNISRKKFFTDLEVSTKILSLKILGQLHVVLTLGLYKYKL